MMYSYYELVFERIVAPFSQSKNKKAQKRVITKTEKSHQHLIPFFQSKNKKAQNRVITKTEKSHQHLITAKTKINFYYRICMGKKLRLINIKQDKLKKRD